MQPLNAVHLLQLSKPGEQSRGSYVGEVGAFTYTFTNTQTLLTGREQVNGLFCFLDQLHVRIYGVVGREERCNRTRARAVAGLVGGSVSLRLVIIGRISVLGIRQNGRREVQEHSCSRKHRGTPSAVLLPLSSFKNRGFSVTKYGMS